MTQKQLEIFLHLSETLNFRKTAEQLYISQTTVSFQIQSLEKELNFKLFERGKRAVSLTPAGVVFKEYTGKILALTNEAINEGLAVAGGYTGFLQLGFCIDTNKAGFADLIKAFSEEHSDIRMQIQGGYPEQLLQSLQFDKCDLFITPYYYKLKEGKMNYWKIGSYKQLVAFHKDHPFNKKESIRFEDFSDVKYIGVTNENMELEFTEEFIEKLKKNNIQPQILIKTDNIDTVFLMLDANVGVSVIPEYFSERLSGSARIQLREIDEDLKGTDLVAVWKKENTSEELKTFIAYMKKFFSERN